MCPVSSLEPLQLSCEIDRASLSLNRWGLRHRVQGLGELCGDLGADCALGATLAGGVRHLFLLKGLAARPALAQCWQRPISFSRLSRILE